MFFYLLAGHFLGDYMLQTDPVALCKCRNSPHPAQKTVPWAYWLTAHAFLHGALVGIILRCHGVPEAAALICAITETILHWIIDLLKCEKFYSIHVDQCLHIICKVGWWMFVTRGLSYLNF
ncbi:MAG: DUF3307 domain-containing protein [Gemmataceae bacterium]